MSSFGLRLNGKIDKDMSRIAKVSPFLEGWSD